MSDFVDEEQAYDDDQMEEVEVDDSAPIDEAESDAGNEQLDTMIDTTPAIDLSFVSFNGHTDSVYCAAIHPTQPGVVITGKDVKRCIQCLFTSQINDDCC
jgi:hypothetical protein